MEGKIRIKLVRSPICTPEKQKLVVKGLGLRKLNQIVERPDTPVFRGMVKKVPHLVELNIGHSIVSRAVFVGLQNAVGEMLIAMEDYSG